MKTKLFMNIILCVVLVLTVGMIAGCKGGDGTTGQAGQNGLPGVNGQDGADGADGATGATGGNGITTVVVVNSNGGTGLGVDAVHAAKNVVKTSRQTIAVAGDDVVIKFDLTVDGVRRGDFTSVSRAQRYAYSETYNTGTAKPYVLTTIPSTSVSVAQGTSTGNYVVTVPGIVSSSVGTAPTRFFITLQDALSGSLEASIVDDLNGQPRSIVSNQACMNCHGDHIWKESSRTYHLSTVGSGACVACHVNKDRGNFMTYVHGIHNSHSMPSRSIGTGTAAFIKPEGVYARNDSSNASNWFSVSYPGNMRTCNACHDTPQSLAAVTSKPVSYSLCMSCHDSWAGWDFKDSSGATIAVDHTGFLSTQDCSGCHNGSFAPATIGDFHPGVNAEIEAGKSIRMEITEVIASYPSSTAVTIKWKAYNPADNSLYDPCTPTADLADGKPTFRAMTALFGYAQGNDWVNAGIGTNPGQPGASPNLFTSASTTCGTDKIAVTTGLALGTTTATKAIIGLQGKPVNRTTASATGSSNARVPSPVREFLVADGSVPTDTRRKIVDSAKCVACHLGTLYQHGGNRVDNTELCVICHNPASNEQGVRQGMNVTVAESYDGRAGQTFDLRTMIHAIHSSGVTGAPIAYYRSNGIYFWGSEDSLPATWPGTGSQTVYGSDTDLISGASVTPVTKTHNFHHVTYPRHLNECEACHVSGSYNVPDQAKAVAVTDENAGASPWGIQTDDVLRGPAAASCMSCHQSTDKFVQASLRQHASQNGWTPAAFTNGRDDILNGDQIETCVVCHGN